MGNEEIMSISGRNCLRYTGEIKTGTQFIDGKYNLKIEFINCRILEVDCI